MPRGSNYHKPDGAEPAVTPPRARVKPRLRGVSHQWAFYLAIPLGVVLTLVAETSRARVAAAVFAASVVGMFGASALYHRVTWRPPTRRWIRRLDHAGIYVLIAGTYTPFGLFQWPSSCCRASRMPASPKERCQLAMLVTTR